MKNDLNDPIFADQGPSAPYAFARNRVIHSEGTPEQVHAAGLTAHLQAVWGDGKPGVQTGIGSPGNENVNHFAAIRKYEGQIAWEKAVKEAYKRDPAKARSLGLPEPARA